MEEEHQNNQSHEENKVTESIPNQAQNTKAAEDNEDEEMTYQLEVELPDAETSDILKQALDVDEELYADVIKREINVEGKIFRLKYIATNEKKLRNALNNIVENAILILQTVHEFKV